MRSEKNPLVSIITPALNRRAFLEACLHSVEAQDYPRIEHIVIDGGSVDGSVELLCDWKGSRLKKWVSEPDGGLYEAVNKGLRMASGDVLAYLNTDDFYFPWTVRLAVNALLAGADMVYGDLLVVRTTGARPTTYVQFYPPFERFRYAWLQTIAQPTVFWRRDVTDSLGPFDTRYRLIADCERWLAMNEAGYRISHISEVMAVQVDHESTLREHAGGRLDAEFRRLRSQYCPDASPWAVRARRVWDKARWRATVFAFVRRLRGAKSSNWGEFAAFVAAHNIQFDSAYPWRFMLPQPWRQRRQISLLDASRLLHAIGVNAGDVLG